MTKMIFFTKKKLTTREVLMVLRIGSKKLFFANLSSNVCFHDTFIMLHSTTCLEQIVKNPKNMPKAPDFSSKSQEIWSNLKAQKTTRFWSFRAMAPDFLKKR